MLLEFICRGLQLIINVMKKILCWMCKKKRISVTFPGDKDERVHTTDVLEIIHSNIMRPMKPASVGDSRYILSLIDGYSRLVKVYFLSTKSHVFEYFIEYRSLMERQTARKTKFTRTDNGTESVNKQFAEECRRSGNFHCTTAPFSPQ